MIKLYQNRHPEINATAYTTFTILGAAIFMGKTNSDSLLYEYTWHTSVLVILVLMFSTFLTFSDARDGMPKEIIFHEKNVDFFGITNSYSKGYIEKWWI